MKQKIDIGGDAPVSRACLKLFPADAGPESPDSFRDIAQGSEAAGQPVLTGVQAQIQEQILGREHPGLHAGNTCWDSACPQALEINGEWPAGAYEVPMDFERDSAGRRLG